jgi:RNA polymerase-binding protein DksA
VSNAEFELTSNGLIGKKMAKRKNNSKSNKNGLTAAEIEKFRELLLAKRRELLGNVSTMEDETFKKERSELSSMPFHMADAGSDNFEQEFSLDLMDSEKNMLKEINDALGRIGEGTFGVCEGKGESIPKARLNAIPWARYCVACAEMQEKGHQFGGEADESGEIPPYEAGTEPEADEESEDEPEADSGSGFDHDSGPEE